MIYGVVSIFSTLGAGIGVPLSGYIYDWTGSYNMAFSVFLVSSIIAGLAGMRAMTLINRRQKQQL